MMKTIMNWIAKKLNNLSFRLRADISKVPEEFIAKKYQYFQAKDLYERIAGFKKDELGTSYMLYRNFDGGVEISEKRFIDYLTNTMKDYKKELKPYFPKVDTMYHEWLKNGKGE